MSVEFHPGAIATAIAGVFTVAVCLFFAAVAIGLVIVVAAACVVVAFVTLVA